MKTISINDIPENSILLSDFRNDVRLHYSKSEMLEYYNSLSEEDKKDISFYTTTVESDNIEFDLVQAIEDHLEYIDDNRYLEQDMYSFLGLSTKNLSSYLEEELKKMGVDVELINKIINKAFLQEGNYEYFEPEKEIIFD